MTKTKSQRTADNQLNAALMAEYAEAGHCPYGYDLPAAIATLAGVSFSEANTALTCSTDHYRCPVLAFMANSVLIRLGYDSKWLSQFNSDLSSPVIKVCMLPDMLCDSKMYIAMTGTGKWFAFKDGRVVTPRVNSKSRVHLALEVTKSDRETGGPFLPFVEMVNSLWD